MVNWIAVGISSFLAPSLSSLPCIYPEQGKTTVSISIIVVRLWMLPLRQHEREKREDVFLLLRLRCFFCNLARSLQLAHTPSTITIPTLLFLSLLCIYSSPWIDQATFLHLWHNRSPFHFHSLSTSFGKRTPSTPYRLNECVILEPSEMLVVSERTMSPIWCSLRWSLPLIDWLSRNRSIAWIIDRQHHWASRRTKNPRHSSRWWRRRRTTGDDAAPKNEFTNASGDIQIR